MRYLVLASVIAACASGGGQDQPCSSVATIFSAHVKAVLTDSTDLFHGAYPPATPLDCENLLLLQEELQDDSARYCFERLSRRYWREDPHARITHRYINRHRSFALAMASVAHWNEDHRIRGLLELLDYRRIRPMVCTTKEGTAGLERQDRAAVRYLISVMETTPLFIGGSENATIHQSYLRTVVETLDLFTGQDHMSGPEQLLGIQRSEAALQQALADWRGWLKE